MHIPAEATFTAKPMQYRRTKTDESNKGPPQPMLKIE